MDTLSTVNGLCSYLSLQKIIDIIVFGWSQVCNAQQLRLVYMATKDNLDKAVIKTKNEVNHPYKVLPNHR